MDIAEAQADLRRAYTNAGPGVVISGLIWLAAAMVERQVGIGTGFAVLFFGGMTIYPLSLLVNRAILKRAAESRDNPYGLLVLESTVAMIAGLIAAWLFLDYRPEWVMPLAAIMVGTHYFAFRTAYGIGTFWALGAAVTMIGILPIFVGSIPADMVAFSVAAVEIVFGVILWRLEPKR